jgi:hypothetical protein
VVGQDGAAAGGVHDDAGAFDAGEPAGLDVGDCARAAALERAPGVVFAAGGEPVVVARGGGGRADALRAVPLAAAHPAVHSPLRRELAAAPPTPQLHHRVHRVVRQRPPGVLHRVRQWALLSPPRPTGINPNLSLSLSFLSSQSIFRVLQWGAHFWVVLRF